MYHIKRPLICILMAMTLLLAGCASKTGLPSIPPDATPEERRQLSLDRLRTIAEPALGLAALCGVIGGLAGLAWGRDGVIIGAGAGMIICGVAGAIKGQHLADAKSLYRYKDKALREALEAHREHTENLRELNDILQEDLAMLEMEIQYYQTASSSLTEKKDELEKLKRLSTSTKAFVGELLEEEEKRNQGYHRSIRKMKRSQKEHTLVAINSAHSQEVERLKVFESQLRTFTRRT